MKKYQIWGFVRPKMTITETLVSEFENFKDAKKAMKSLRDEYTERGRTFHIKTVDN